MRTTDLRRIAFRAATIGVLAYAALLPEPARSDEAEVVVPQAEKPAPPRANAPEEFTADRSDAEKLKKPATLSTTAPARPARAADPAVTAKVKGLIDDLADPDWKVRKQASDALERLGEPAEPALEEALTRRDLSLDARSSIEVLLKQAAERRRIGATLITLDMASADPLAAVSAVLEPGGAEAQFRRGDAAEIRGEED